MFDKYIFDKIITLVSCILFSGLVYSSQACMDQEGYLVFNDESIIGNDIVYISIFNNNEWRWTNVDDCDPGSCKSNVLYNGGELRFRLEGQGIDGYYAPSLQEMYGPITPEYCKQPSRLRTTYIDSFKSVCFGMFQTLCLRERPNQSSDFGNNYGGIIGFHYQWGHHYELIVRDEDVIDPPADGSSIDTYLEEIISVTEDPVGSLYEYQSIEAYYVNYRNNEYRFLGQVFSCLTDSLCESLLALEDPTVVDLTFEYAGNGEIRLINYYSDYYSQP